MQVILDSSFARPGSAPIWGGKKGEFRDWTTWYPAVNARRSAVIVLATINETLQLAKGMLRESTSAGFCE